MNKEEKIEVIQYCILMIGVFAIITSIIAFRFGEVGTSNILLVQGAAMILKYLYYKVK